MSKVIITKKPLGSDLRVLSLVEIKGSKFLDARVVINRGSASDASYSKMLKKDVAGISHFIEHLRYKRTKYHSGDKLREAMKSVGTRNASTEMTTITMFNTGTIYSGSELVNLLLEVFTNDLTYITPEEFESEKQTVINEITHYSSNHDVQHNLAVAAVTAGLDHKATILGTVESVSQITLEDCIAVNREILASRAEITITFDSEVINAEGVRDFVLGNEGIQELLQIKPTDNMLEHNILDIVKIQKPITIESNRDNAIVTVLLPLDNAEEFPLYADKGKLQGSKFRPLSFVEDPYEGQVWPRTSQALSKAGMETMLALAVRWYTEQAGDCTLFNIIREEKNLAYRTVMHGTSDRVYGISSLTVTAVVSPDKVGPVAEAIAETMSRGYYKFIGDKNCPTGRKATVANNFDKLKKAYLRLLIEDCLNLKTATDLPSYLEDIDFNGTEKELLPLLIELSEIDKITPADMSALFYHINNLVKKGELTVVRSIPTAEKAGSDA